MNFKYTGLFISILILLSILITCHMRNYFIQPKCDFINLAVPTGTPPLKYNKITYIPELQKIPCEIANQGNFPCNQIQPCTTVPSEEQLSESELAILYKEAYELAGLEIIRRTLEKANTQNL